MNVSKTTFDFVPSVEIQESYHDAFAKEWNYIKSGRGAGKSEATSRLAIYKALIGESVLVVREIQGSHKNSTYAQIIKNLDMYEIPYKAVTSPVPRIQIGKSLILYAGMDKVDKIKSMIPLQSNPISIIWFEEATEIKPKLDFNEAIEVINKILFTFGRGQNDVPPKVVFTYNPDVPGHWLEEKEKEIGFEDYENFTSLTYKDNKYLNNKFIESLKRYKETWPAYYRQVAYGEWMNLGQKVYLDIPTFTELKSNMVDKIFIGVDIGFVDDTAFTCTVLQNGIYKVIAEESFNNEDFNVIEQKLYDFIKTFSYLETSERIQVIVEYASGGIHLIKTLKSKLSVNKFRVLKTHKPKTLGDAILGINKLISQGKYQMKDGLEVHKEFANMVYENDKPVGVNDHKHDSAKYGISYEIYRNK